MNIQFSKKHLLALIVLINPLLALAQECNENMAVDTPNERFENQGNGTVLDRNTHLVWKICAEGQTYNSLTESCDGDARLFVANEALAFTENINSVGFAGHTDWRVPNIKELLSIVESSCVNPSINISVFKGAPSGYFRSSTPVGLFYCVNFANGSVSSNCDSSGLAGGGMGGGMGFPDIYEGHLRFIRDQ